MVTVIAPTKRLNIKLGILVRDARQRKGYSQWDLAERMRCTAGYISMLETGRVLSVRPEFARRLEWILDISREELVKALGY